MRAFFSIVRLKEAYFSALVPVLMREPAFQIFELDSFGRPEYSSWQSFKHSWPWTSFGQVSMDGWSL
jgi:hypothetical protein